MLKKTAFDPPGGGFLQHNNFLLERSPIKCTIIPGLYSAGIAINLQKQVNFFYNPFLGTAIVLLLYFLSPLYLSQLIHHRKPPRRSLIFL